MKRYQRTPAIKKMFFLFAALFFNTLLFAQQQNTPEELMRSNGKIYVVVAVCLTILIGLFVYVFLIDRKIGKIEKEN
jgi:CcmD family protein